MVKILTTALLTFSTPLHANEDQPLSGKIWNVTESKFSSFGDMLNDISSKKYIILGERHGREAHQGREAFIIGALAEAGRYPNIAFEMLTHEQDVIVKEYRQKSPEYALGLATHLKWSESNWPSWSFYHPVFDAAFTTKANIYGADLTEAEQKAAANKTVASTTPRKSFPYYKEQMTDAHCGLIDNDRVQELARLQIARDQNMAKVIKDKSDPIHGSLLVVGSAHIRKSSGIPNYLDDLDTVVILMSESDQNTGAFLTPYQDIISGDINDFDYIWFTPKIDKKSLCDRIAPPKN